MSEMSETSEMSESGDIPAVSDWDAYVSELRNAQHLAAAGRDEESRQAAARAGAALLRHMGEQ